MISKTLGVFESKHKGVQTQNKYLSDDLKNCLERNKIVYGAKYFFTSKKHELSLVKQPKIALVTFEDKKFYII